MKKLTHFLVFGVLVLAPAAALAAPPAAPTVQVGTAGSMVTILLNIPGLNGCNLRITSGNVIPPSDGEEGEIDLTYDPRVTYRTVRCPAGRPAFSGVANFARGQIPVSDGIYDIHLNGRSLPRGAFTMTSRGPRMSAGPVGMPVQPPATAPRPSAAPRFSEPAKPVLPDVKSGVPL